MIRGSEPRKKMSSEKKVARSNVEAEPGEPLLSVMRPTWLTIWKISVGPTPRLGSGGRTASPVIATLSTWLSPSNCWEDVGADVTGPDGPAVSPTKFGA